MSLKSLSFQLFGAPRVLRDGVSLHGKATQRRRVALLALLAASPSRTLSRDRLVGLIWPERDSTQARKLLSEALYVVRRELGEEVVDTSNGDQVTLSAEAMDCDLWAFAAALERGALSVAVDLSEAPFLDGVYLDEAEEFDRWLEGERRRIAQERERALLSLASSAERDDRWLDASRAWQQLLHDDPYSGRFVLGAANALAEAGERPAALQLLTTFEERLQRELEVAPEPEVVELAERLRAERAPNIVRHRTASPTRPVSAILPDVRPVIGKIPTPSVELPAPPRGAGAPILSTSRAARWPLFLGVLGVVVALAASVLWYQARPDSDSVFESRRLAVLYFRDGSTEGDLGSIADLLTESVIEQLAGSPAFEVIPVSGVRQVRDGSIGVDSVARRFRVASVVDGAVHRRGENLVVRVRLIDSKSGAVVWSSGLERSVYELFALEEEVAREIAIGVRQRLGREVRLTELQRESSNVRAWRLVARGSREREDATKLADRGLESDSAAAERGLQRADSLFRQAAIEDPNWVRPVVERAWTTLEAIRWMERPQQIVALDQALARVDSLPEQQRERASVLEVASAVRWLRVKWMPPPLDSAELKRTIADLERAVDAEPELARAWASLSNIYWIRGDVERAEQAGRRALAADAYIEDAPTIYRMLFATSLYQSTLDSASAWCERGRREYAADWWFRECQLTVMKYDTHARPDADRAWRIVAETDSLDPPARAAAAGHGYSPIYRRMVAAAVSARAGDLTRARAELDRQRAAAENDSMLALDLAPDEITLLLQFGDREAAVRRLRWAVERRPLLEGVARQDPILRTLTEEALADTRRATRVPVP